MNGLAAAGPCFPLLLRIDSPQGDLHGRLWSGVTGGWSAAPMPLRYVDRSQVGLTFRVLFGATHHVGSGPHSGGCLEHGLGGLLEGLSHGLEIKTRVDGRRRRLGMVEHATDERQAVAAGRQPR